MMKWEKKGKIYELSKDSTWMKSHTQCPTAIVLRDKIRIFFSARDSFGESLPTFIDVSKENPSEILYQHPEPVLLKGRKGTFDENGIIPSYFIEKNGEIYFYYAGWSRSENVPYKNFTGLAISKDGGNTFKKYSEAPVFTMDENNPLSATGPCIVYHENKYKCVYSTGKEWIMVNGKLEHTYLLVNAFSNDAINWFTTNKIVIEPENEFIAHCKPAFFIKNNVFHMWFSKRGSYDFRKGGDTAYRLGYATSKNFIEWERTDLNGGIDVSKNGWASEMICYPHIVETEKNYIMFYNGNGFGKSGFGYAIISKE